MKYTYDAFSNGVERTFDLALYAGHTAAESDSVRIFLTDGTTIHARISADIFAQDLQELEDAELDYWDRMNDWGGS